MTTADEADYRMTQDEMVATLRERFGDDPMDWAFVCPHCGDIATGRDFREALASTGRDGFASSHLGQECIGRILGAIKRGPDGEKIPYTGRGCDWVAYGLFRGPMIITLDNGKEVGGFRIAPAPTT